MKLQHLAACAAGLVAIVAVASLFDLSRSGLVPLLVLLGCPLMMLLMMRGRKHGRSSHGSTVHGGHRLGSSNDDQIAGNSEPPVRRER